MNSTFKAIIICILLFISNAIPTLAQDTIRTKDGRLSIAKITIVGTDDVTYKLFNDQNGPTFITRKKDINQIVLQSGTVLGYEELNRRSTRHALPTSIVKLDSKKNALKWEVLSVATNDICFGYERSLNHNQSIELKVAYIGLGDKTYGSNYLYDKASGYFVKLGYKFINTKSGDKNSMIGSYIKPEICYTEFNENFINYKSKYAMLNFGVQSILSSSFILEFYAGIGISYNESDQITNFLYPNYFDIARSYYYSNSSIEGTINKYSTCLSGGMVLSYHF